MNFGIEQNNNKCFCKECKKELKIEVPEIFNFCPFCSAPLNLVAFNVLKEKEKTAKLNTLAQLAKTSKNKDTLLEIKLLLNKISKE